MLAMTPQGAGSLTLGKELGKGGEGSVYALESLSLAGLPPASRLVAKIYHEPNAENRAAKLKAMVTSPVHDPSVAWPLAVVLDDNKRFLGYLMEKLDSTSYREWLYVANMKDRRVVAPEFDVRYAYAAIRNLTAALIAVHHEGHRVGDLNESNIFLGADATVLIVDTDSMQVTARNGQVFPCAVGKPEFTAPELTHGSLRDHQRTVETDLFAFAVAVYQLLTGGATPHQGSFDPESDDDPLPQVQRIREGVLPSLDPQRALTYGFTPRPGVPVGAFPNFIREHLKTFLSVDPSERGDRFDLMSLLQNLDSFIPHLEQCSKEPLHWSERGFSCPWCAEAQRSGHDPWSKASNPARELPTQARLTPISFHESSQPTGTGRATAAVAGQQAHAAHQQAQGIVPSGNVPTNNTSAASPASAASVQGVPQGAQPATSAPQRPHKVKGKITVAYADGSWGVRPPLSQLFRQRPSMALHAMREETPALLKFWWPITRDLANPLGAGIGFALSLVLALLWHPVTTWVLAQITPYIALSESLIFQLSFIPLGTAILVSFLLLVSALRDRHKAKKQQGSLTGFKREGLVLTASRFLPIGFFYGLPIVLILIVVLLLGIFTFIKAVVKA